MSQLEGLDFIREKVRQRDNHTCQSCKKQWKLGQRRLDVHHLDLKMESRKRYAYDSKHLDKLITLCHKCHLNLPHIRAKLGSSRFDPKALAKRKRVYELKQNRYTFKEIGQLFGVTKQRIHQMYKIYIEKDIHTPAIDQ